MTQDNAGLNNDMDREKQSEKKPDETTGLLMESKIKIFDPDSGEIMVEGRA